MFETYTDEARSTTSRAMAESRRLRHRYVGTEHLLLALLTGDDRATALLQAAGADHERLRSELTGGHRRSPLPRAAHTAARVTDSAQATFARSRDTAAAFGHPGVRTEHVLLALLDGRDNTACRLLTATGVEVAELRRHTAAAVSARP